MNENTISNRYRFLKDRSAMVAGLVLTIILELITVVLRFGARLESTRDTASTIGRLTFGLRIHHGYVGLATILVAYALSDHYPKASRLLWIVGIGLFFSDMIHHFLVLWPITGSPHFDLFYPSPN